VLRATGDTLNAAQRAIYESYKRIRARASEAALFFKGNPVEYAKAQVLLHEIEKPLRGGGPPTESPDRLAVALRRFEMHAKAYLPFVVDMESQDHYRHYLAGIRMQVLEYYYGFFDYTMTYTGLLEPEQKIRQCFEEWVNEGYKRLIPSPPPDPDKSDGPEAERDRRKRLLDEYKSATGNPANHKIYSAENVPIHKPEFYEWQSGDLPATSATTQNFERFLRAKKPPL
jgi:hypothetical protein